MDRQEIQIELREAAHRWVLAVDNDANLAPDALELMLPHLLQDNVVIVQPRAVFDGERDRIHYDGADMHYAGIMTLHGFYAPARNQRALLEADGARVARDLAVVRLWSAALIRS